MHFLEKNTHTLRKFVSGLQLNGDAALSSVKNLPKLTIITPSYNQAPFLERTILSILNQNYPNLEYLIVDGGSTDESVEVIKKYEKYITWWISEKDKGQVDAINKALRRATGDYISFQNSDDVYFPGTFKRFGEAAAQYKTDILYGDLYMISTDDEVIELLKTTSFDFDCQILEGMQIHNQSLFFKRGLVEKYGLFDESYRFAFDYEFVTRYTAHKQTTTKKIEGLAGALRIHADAKSSTIAHVGSEEHKRVQELYISTNSSALLNKIKYLWCRVRKIVYFISRFDFKYIRYRFSK
ncbi:glycosyltransferase family 2 protein [Dyadobacter aurulentus]|uniref:glycosyltransferase family 2 protein n=1 Tax=Dyadobacter sp. UC 10 TaxID=2605428 RepID=UPI0011F09DBF|nr:glycosyltransferase family 2 protein [Dyadobacter sp. UC 10]KAA0991599.1 glycosyltransferase [Dyadobacter sp. UC 10]